MEKDQIRTAINNLPEIPAGKYPIEDPEIFEGDDHGGHFKITRNYLVLAGARISYYTLSVSGISGESRRRIIEDFTHALGKPGNITYNKNLDVHFVYWTITTSQPQA